MNKKFELAKGDEVNTRKREVQILVNIIEPDPNYQPILITDESSIYDLFAFEEDEIRKKLSFYFNEPFTIPIDIPVYEVIDKIKQWKTTWPVD